MVRCKFMFESERGDYIVKLACTLQVPQDLVVVLWRSGMKELYTIHISLSKT